MSSGWIVEGLKLLGSIADSGAIEAVKQGIAAFTEGVHGKITPDIVLEKLKALDRVAADNVAALKELHAKYHTNPLED